MDMKTADTKDLELITKSECDEIIKNSTDKFDKWKVSDFNLNKIEGDIPGFLGEYYNLTIIIQNEDGNTDECRYFVKTLPFSEKEQCKLIEQFGIFKKETLLYSFLFPEINGNKGASKWRPECYLVKDYLIVMEDMRRLNYMNLPARFLCTNRHIEVALQTLSRMHSTCLNYELKDPKNPNRIRKLSDEYLFETSVLLGGSWFATGLKTILTVALRATKYGHDTPSGNFISSELLARMNRIYELMEQSSDEFANVICHRDIWRNNMMFQFKKSGYEEPENCVILDFQICRYLPPAIDVLLAIYLNTNRSNRNEFYNHYLTYYYSALQQQLNNFNMSINDIMKWEEFMKSVNYYKIIPLIFNAVYIQLTHLPAGTLDSLRKNNLAKYNSFAHVDRDDVVMDAMEKDDYFKEYIVESVEELIEYLFEKELQ